MVNLKIDSAHSTISFVVKHMMFAKVRGTFGAFEGTINFDETNPANSSATATIEASSINTQEENRDNHLRSNDFFGTESNPTITFVSTSVEPKGGDYLVHGDLTMNGVTRPLVLETEFNGKGNSPMGAEVYSFSAEGKLKRTDFNINWNAALETGGFLVSDEVKIEVEIEANPVA
jgi:polyisoprenoid-binding protein YceI